MEELSYGEANERSRIDTDWRFGRDSIIGLATVSSGIPYVRNVNAFYLSGAFYVLTYGLSNKMKQIEVNPMVAIAGDWFTAHGKSINLGYFGKEENKDIANMMRVFSGNGSITVIIILTM